MLLSTSLQKCNSFYHDLTVLVVNDPLLPLSAYLQLLLKFFSALPICSVLSQSVLKHCLCCTGTHWHLHPAVSFKESGKRDQINGFFIKLNMLDFWQIWQDGFSVEETGFFSIFYLKALSYPYRNPQFPWWFSNYHCNINPVCTFLLVIFCPLLC